MDEEVTRDRLDDPSAACPAQAELVAFDRGKLPGMRMEHVGAHVAGCAQCDRVLRALSDESDPLIGSLRTSQTQVEYFQEPGCRRLQARAGALSGGEPAAPSGPPARLGPYLLVRRLKGGGMGDVYEARHTRLDRAVALKTLRSDRMHNPDLVERFNREMKAVGKLNHPNIVAATDAGEADGWHFLVMELVDGCDLTAVVRAHGPLAVADAAELARQTALGLQCVHDHGLVHRDIKPSNLMLGAGGTVKILDLGLALLHEGQAPGDELTESGFGLGTADYMSPEQAQDAHRVTIQSDLYSLGCTLYKLLTGRAPFDSPDYRSTLKKMQAHLSDLVPPLQQRRPDVPAELAAIVHRLLEKDPRRFAVPREVAEALERFTAGSDLARLLQEARDDTACAAAARVTPSPLPIAQPTAPQRPWRRRAIGGGVALVVCGMVVAILVGPRRDVQKVALVAPAKDQPIAWPADFPQVLRDRPMGARIELLRPTEWKDGPRDPAQGNATFAKNVKGVPVLPYQPLWFRRLSGTGVFFAMPLALVLNSNEISRDRLDFGQEYTALALDDDLALRWFEFDAELWPGQGGVRAGIFFGWRAIDDQRGAYFLQLDAPLVAGENGPQRRALVGYLKLPAVPGGAANQDAPFDALAADAVAVIPLGQARNRYHLKVQCVPGQVTITADDEPAARFAPRFETRGSLGIWARRGSAWFGRAAVGAIPQ